MSTLNQNNQNSLNNTHKMNSFMTTIKEFIKEFTLDFLLGDEIPKVNKKQYVPTYYSQSMYFHMSDPNDLTDDELY